MQRERKRDRERERDVGEMGLRDEKNEIVRLVENINNIIYRNNIG